MTGRLAVRLQGDSPKMIAVQCVYHGLVLAAAHVSHSVQYMKPFKSIQPSFSSIKPVSYVWAIYMQSRKY